MPPTLSLPNIGETEDRRLTTPGGWPIQVALWLEWDEAHSLEVFQQHHIAYFSSLGERQAFSIRGGHNG